MPSAIHEIAVQKILHDYPSAKIGGLMKAIRAGVGPDDAQDFKFGMSIPDAYIVDPPNKTVVLFEVEVRHPINDDKMENYSGLWWALDWLDWDLLLVTTDKWGVKTGEIDVGMFAFGKVAHDARKEANR